MRIKEVELREAIQEKVELLQKQKNVNYEEKILQQERRK